MDTEVLKDLTVLYVEDDETTRDNMSKILERFFKKTISVGDGDIGYKTFEKHFKSNDKIDIVLSDIKMPNLSGIDMISHIRLLDENVPVVLLTAHSEANYLLDAINLNISQYVVKPVNTTSLFESLKKAYLPVYQKKLLEEKNKELELLNAKIKKVAKEEIERVRSGGDYLHEDEGIDYSELFNNIKIDE